MKNIFSPFVTYRTKRLQTVTDRQERLEDFDQEALRQAKVIQIGAGGLGSETGQALVRKGIGTLIIFDDDFVEPTNLNRQRFFARDLNKNKARRLARNLAQEGFCGSVIKGYDLRLEDAIERGIDLDTDIVIVGVDNDPARIAASRFFRNKAVPVIFTAVSHTANNGYVFIQEPGKACFVCLFPDSVNDETYPCPGTPAVLDILKVVAGIVVYAVDSLLMKRPRFWNYKDVFLDGSIPGNDWNIASRKDCVLCQGD